jgi:oxaloacetate decarboxylase
VRTSQVPSGRLLRDVISDPGCTLVAPIFDPLSARVADMLGWRAVKLSGSVGKYANLALPDSLPISNISDLVDVVRRITRVCEAPLVVDADDGGSVYEILRVVRELEAAGAAAIEIEDNVPPGDFQRERHSVMVPKAVHVAKLEAAVQARKDSSTLIVGRTAALSTEPLEAALDRIDAYSNTGVDAIMLPGGSRGISEHPRSDIEAVRRVCGRLPIFVSHLPPELVADRGWLEANDVRLRFADQVVFRMAVAGMVEGLKSLLEDEGSTGGRGASGDLLAQLVRTSELRTWGERFPGGGLLRCRDLC